MDALECLRLQLRLEGKDIVRKSLLRQVEFVPGEEMPLMILALLPSRELAAYFDENLSSELRDELARHIHSLNFPSIDPIIAVLKIQNIEVEVGHYKTYLFPDHYKKSEADEVKRYPKSDLKIQVFGFGGFTEQIHAIERNRKIVSACVSARENDCCGEAWVTTDEDYRRQGLAQKVVSAWASDLMKAGKVPFYSHKINNIGSAKLAKRLGLEPVFEEIVISHASQ